MALDAHGPHHVSHRLRSELLHQIGGDVVRTVGETPLEGDGLTDPDILVGTSRSPLVLAYYECLRDIDHLGAWSHSGLHRQCVEERLDRGAHLTLALADIVIFEISVVRTSDIGLDVACDRLDCHEAGPED